MQDFPNPGHLATIIPAADLSGRLLKLEAAREPDPPRPVETQACRSARRGSGARDSHELEADHGGCPTSTASEGSRSRGCRRARGRSEAIWVLSDQRVKVELYSWTARVRLLWIGHYLTVLYPRPRWSALSQRAHLYLLGYLRLSIENIVDTTCYMCYMIICRKYVVYHRS